MTAAQAIETQSEPCGHGGVLPLDDVKARLAGGSLAAALPALMPSADGAAGADEIIGVRLRQEKHRRESTSMVLDVDLLPAGAAVPTPRSLVLHYPRAGSHSAVPRDLPSGVSGDSHRDVPADRSPLAWWYPADPYLPALQLTARPDTLLRGRDWRTTAGRGWRPDACYAARRLGYKPGQRASFLLEARQRAGDPAPPMVLKIVRRDAFQELLHRATVLGGSPLRQLIAIPRLIAVSPVHQAFLYEYQAGQGLDTLAPADLAALRPVLATEFLRLTGLIHATDPGGLPAWSARVEMDKSRPLVEQVRRRSPAAEPALLAVVTRLGQEFARREPAGQLIHNDFTARNLLCTSNSRVAGTGDARPAVLNLIDWDSAVAGPVERDLAAFLSARLLDDDQVQGLLDQYGQGTGRRLDRSLVNSFISHQRLLKACRRFLVSGAHPRLADDVHLVASRLERNPLAG